MKHLEAMCGIVDRSDTSATVWPNICTLYSAVQFSVMQRSAVDNQQFSVKCTDASWEVATVISLRDVNGLATYDMECVLAYNKTFPTTNFLTFSLRMELARVLRLMHFPIYFFELVNIKKLFGCCTILTLSEKGGIINSIIPLVLYFSITSFVILFCQPIDSSFKNGLLLNANKS